MLYKSLDELIEIGEDLYKRCCERWGKEFNLEYIEREEKDHED